MKRMTQRALLVAMWAALACSASAAGQTSHPHHAGQPGDQAEQHMPMGDQDRDSRISAQEHAAAAEAMFKRMDADNDGYLTAAELEHGRRTMAGAGAQRGAGGMMGHDRGHGTGSGMMGQGMGQGMGPGMMDRDGDGSISAQEHAAMAQMMFQRMDTDRDGKISADEMGRGRGMGMGMMMGGGKPGAGMGAMGAGMGMGMVPADRIRMMDADGDGRISSDEHAAGVLVLFKQADTDKDGVLSSAERAAHHALMMRRVKD